MQPEEVQKFLQTNDITSYSFELEYSEENRKNSDLVIQTYEMIIVPYYQQRGFNVNSGMYNYLVEPIKNANYYSLRQSKQKGLFSIMMAPTRFVAQYCDGGDYFKRKDVKNCWEHKEYHPEKQPLEKGLTGYGIGRKFIFELSDFIFVDTTQGSLYMGINIPANIHLINKL